MATGRFACDESRVRKTASNKAGAANTKASAAPAKKTLSPEQQVRQDEILARQKLWQQAGIASDPKVIRKLPSFSEQSPYRHGKTLLDKAKHFIWCYQHRPWHERSVLPLRIVTGSISAWYVVAMINSIVQNDRATAVTMMMFFPAIVCLFMLNFLKLK